MTDPTQLKFEGQFRYNGADLALMKKLAGTLDPHKAVEAFIEKAIAEYKDPQEALKEAHQKATNG